MNKRRRERLNEAVQYLTKASSIVEGACDQEQDAMDNMPENLQDSDRHGSMESAVDALESASEKIDDAITLVRDAVRG